MTTLVATIDDVIAIPAPEFSQAPFNDHVLTIEGNTNGDYTVLINQSSFAHSASGDTVLQIRDALVVLIQGGSEPVTALAISTDRIAVIQDPGGIPGYGVEVSATSTGSPITIAMPTFDGALAKVLCFPVSVARYGDCYSEATAVLVAHLFSTLPVGRSAAGVAGLETGTLASHADGPASRSWNGPVAFGASAAGFDTSPYGRMFLVMQRVVRGRGSMVLARRTNRRIL